MGLPLAFALLIILFYKYNVKKSSNNEATFIAPNASVITQSTSTNNSPFGIIQKEKNQFQKFFCCADLMAIIDEN